MLTLADRTPNLAAYAVLPDGRRLWVWIEMVAVYESGTSLKCVGAWANGWNPGVMRPEIANAGDWPPLMEALVAGVLEDGHMPGPLVDYLMYDSDVPERFRAILCECMTEVTR